MSTKPRNIEILENTYLGKRKMLDKRKVDQKFDEKILRGCKESLKEILEETRKLNQFNWIFQGKSYKNKLERVKTKLEKRKDDVSRFGKSFKLKNQQAFIQNINEIEDLIDEINLVFTEKGWLKEKMTEYKSISKTIYHSIKIISTFIKILCPEYEQLLLSVEEFIENLLFKATHLLPSAELEIS